MQLDTVINKSNRLRTSILGIMQLGIRQSHTHQRILDRLSRDVYQNPEYKSLPRYAQNRLNGYIEGYFESIWCNCVTWHVKLDSKYILGHDVPSGRWFEVTPGDMLWNGSKEVYT